MLIRKIGIAMSLLAVCLLGAGAAFGVAAGEKAKGKGVITNRAGDTLTVKTQDGPLTLVVASDSKIQHPVGLGARHKQVGPEVLIPGLKLKFEGVFDDQGRVVVKQIDYDTDDLALAEVIQAGLNPTAEQQARNMQIYAENKQATDAAIAANRREIDANRERIAANQANIEEVARNTAKRFSEMTDWEAKNQINVHFAVGDSTISPDHKREIASFAQDALKHRGYVIEVRGFADSTGSLAANQVLSKDRAEAVIAYLLQECSVPVKNIVSPGAMSERNPIASNETEFGRAENRRVDLKLLVNKAVGTGGN